MHQRRDSGLEDTGKEESRTGGIKEKRDTGKKGFGTGGIKERRFKEQEIYILDRRIQDRKKKMQERREAEKEGRRT